MGTEILVAAIGLLAGFVTGVLSLWTAIYTGKIELKKRKPEVVPHQCRISRLDVYTYITGKKAQTPPVCPYLDASDFVTCGFNPENERTDALKMKEVNQNRCYLALFAKEFNLE